jgi:hypothetical protein
VEACFNVESAKQGVPTKIINYRLARGNGPNYGLRLGINILEVGTCSVILATLASSYQHNIRMVLGSSMVHFNDSLFTQFLAIIGHPGALSNIKVGWFAVNGGGVL